jgi:hypothetical protein
LRLLLRRIAVLIADGSSTFVVLVLETATATSAGDVAVVSAGIFDADVAEMAVVAVVAVMAAGIFDADVAAVMALIAAGFFIADVVAVMALMAAGIFIADVADMAVMAWRAW